MLYVILIIVFIAVFAFLFWRILVGRNLQHSQESDATYVCPVCNENECECHKVDDSE
jgi:hypothetical protein